MSMLQTGYFQSRPRGPLCQVEFDRPEPTYSPGDEIKGKIYLRITNAKSPLQGVITRLVGYERYSQGLDFVPQVKIFLVLESYAPLDFEELQESGTPVYLFKFTTSTTSTIPPSLHTSSCAVQYFVEIVYDERQLLEVEETLNHYAEYSGRRFTISPYYDLNSTPELFGPVFLVKDNTGGLRSLFTRNKTPIRFTFSLYKKGFVVTENIHFTVHVNNGSSNPITSTRLKLIQDIKRTTHGTYAAGKCTSETIEKVEGPIVGPRSTASWDGIIRITKEIPITMNTHLFSITYRLRVILTTSGLLQNVKGDLGITIGTIPIDEFEFLQPQQRSNSFGGGGPDGPTHPGRRRHLSAHHSFRSAAISTSQRRSIASLPTYVSMERDDVEDYPPPPTYTEATNEDDTNDTSELHPEDKNLYLP